MHRERQAYGLLHGRLRLRRATGDESGGADPAQVKRFKVDDLAVVKLSYPRAQAQGGAFERDMHGGQQYVPLLDIDLG